MTTVTRPGFQAAGEVDADGAQARLQAAVLTNAQVVKPAKTRPPHRPRSTVVTTSAKRSAARPDISGWPSRHDVDVADASARELFGRLG
jgi:hypothetical protein